MVVYDVVRFPLNAGYERRHRGARNYMTSPIAIERQTALPLGDFTDAIRHLSKQDDNSRGAVYTRHEVVDFILDLTGYTITQPLHQYRLLEPSFGDGHFLLAVVDRLLTAFQSDIHSGRKPPKTKGSQIAHDLRDAIRAVELHPASFARTRAALAALFQKHKISDSDAESLLKAWLIEGDFLLADIPGTFTHVVGNPPYVRQERVPNILLNEYRARFSTMYDRADLYVPFIERSLSCLAAGGAVGFICSDRWMKNKYGGPLRAMVAAHFHLAAYIDMVDTPAFHSEVIAYPAITLIRREKPGSTRIAHRPSLDPAALARLSSSMKALSLSPDCGVVEINNVVTGSEPWMLQSFDQLAVARRLEREFPTLEEAGCKVGIGVATGADKVFIGAFNALDVEPSRKLPLVGTKDINSGTVKWQERGVINPFEDDGSLASLSKYPRFGRYLEHHSDIIRKRNCAIKSPNGWYRTIDRIDPGLLCQPKLLIPDIKGQAHVVYESGQFYPHHNLYYITSKEWDLKALQTVLRSGIAKLFVSLYSTQMRGGYLRFQAQYLRRIRIPRWEDVPPDIRKQLTKPFHDDVDTTNQAVFDLYRLTRGERAALGGNGKPHEH